MEKLGVDIKLLIAQGINFLVFFYLFKKFISLPFLKFLSEEKEKELAKSRLEEEINKKRDEFLLEEKRKREELKKELATMKEELKKEMLQEKEKIIDQAKKQAQTIKERANKEIEAEKVRLEVEIKNKIGQSALILVEKGLKDLLTTDIERELTRNIIKSLKTKKIN